MILIKKYFRANLSLNDATFADCQKLKLTFLMTI